MADIRNDQYLHRPGAGRGAITPADPMEVMLYGPNGQPISATNRLAVEATLSGSSASEGGAPPAQILAVGGRYDATPRLLSNGQFGAIALSPEGRVITEMVAQDFQIFNATPVSAGATVYSTFFEVNGYNSLGIFVHHAQAASFNWELALEWSPTGTTQYYAGADDLQPFTSTNRVRAFKVPVGYARFARLRYTNKAPHDVTLRGWVQLIF